MLFIVFFSFILRCIKKYLGVMYVDVLVIPMCLTFFVSFTLFGGGLNKKKRLRNKGST